MENNTSFDSKRCQLMLDGQCSSEIVLIKHMWLYVDLKSNKSCFPRL